MIIPPRFIVYTIVAVLRDSIILSKLPLSRGRVSRSSILSLHVLNLRPVWKVSQERRPHCSKSGDTIKGWWTDLNRSDTYNIFSFMQNAVIFLDNGCWVDGQVLQFFRDDRRWPQLQQLPDVDDSG